MHILLLLLLLQLLLHPRRSPSPETSASGLPLSPYAAARSALLAGSGTAAFANARGMPRADLSVNRVRAS